MTRSGVRIYLATMQTLTASKARAGFGRVARKVIKTRQPVIVEMREGKVQIVPYDAAEEVPPAPRGALGKFSREELWLHNHFGESL